MLLVDEYRDRKNWQQCQADFDLINTLRILVVSNQTNRART